VLDPFATPSGPPRGTELLSDREMGILRLMATGAANKAIAAHLCISESTVKTHIQSIFQKLDVNDRTEAVTHALQKGIISL
jgi:DNA-binding NarL/FixJ family response regulator